MLNQCHVNSGSPCCALKSELVAGREGLMVPLHTEASPVPAGSRRESAQKDRFECTVVAHLPCYD